MINSNWLTKIDYANLPDKISQANNYITEYISGPIIKYKEDCKNGLVDKWLLFYFGFGGDKDLKKARSLFKEDLNGKPETQDSILKKTMEYKLILARNEPDVYDVPSYSICFYKGNYMVIGIQKFVTGKKVARGHQIAFAKSEAPMFYDRCLTNLQKA